MMKTNVAVAFRGAAGLMLVAVSLVGCAAPDVSGVPVSPKAVPRFLAPSKYDDVEGNAKVPGTLAWCAQRFDDWRDGKRAGGAQSLGMKEFDDRDCHKWLERGWKRMRSEPSR